MTEVNNVANVRGDDPEDGAQSFVPALRKGTSVQLATDTGNIDLTGVLPPFLQIIAKTSDLAPTFGIGSLVLAKEVLLAKAGEPLTMIVLKKQQYVKEQLPFGVDVRPRVFETKEQARAAGLRCEFSADGEKPQADYAMDFMLLVEKPAPMAESSYFGVEILGKSYAIARTSFDKMAYVKGVALSYLQSLAYAMAKKKDWEAQWQLKTQIYVNRKKPQNTTYVPFFKLDKMNSPEFIAALMEQFGAWLTAVPLVATAEEPADELAVD